MICAYFNNALDINLGDLGRPLFPVAGYLMISKYWFNRALL
jgi:hypothetical protein